MTSESQMLAAISEIFNLGPNPEIEIGIGDDAAVVAPTSRKRLYATDMVVEGSHFRRDWSTPREIGGKVTAANLADIYAMGGTPRFLLVAAGIPSPFTLNEIRELAQGIQGEADLVGARVIGGDLTRAEKLTISITVIGEVEEPILRSTARAGDSIVISALTGYSALGYELLKQGTKDARSTHHRKPNVIYSKVADLTADERARFTSLIDTSDSLISEANHIASASGMQLQLSTELISELPGFTEIDFLARNEHLDLWKMILHGGEDHRFLGTVSGDLPEGFFAIGKVIAGTGVTVDGTVVSHEGFDQFAIE